MKTFQQCPFHQAIPNCGVARLAIVFPVGLAAIVLMLASRTEAQTYEWKNNNGTANWSSNGSWDPAGIPNLSTENAQFIGPANGGNSNANLQATSVTIDYLLFGATAENYTISSSGGGVLSINNANAIQANNTVGVNTISAPITLLNSTPNISQAAGGTLNISGTFTGGATGTAFIGGGTINLNGSASYSGPTLVGANTTLGVGSGATLTATSSSGVSLTSTSKLQVNTGGTLLLNSAGTVVSGPAGANLTLAGGQVTAGVGGSTTVGASLTLSANSIIDFGALGTIITFGDSSANSWTGNLLVYNYTPGSDQLFFGNTFGAGVNDTQRGQILFYSDAGTTFLGSAEYFPAGEVAPVPEPSAVLVGLSLLSLAGFRERRWFLRCREARGKAEI